MTIDRIGVMTDVPAWVDDLLYTLSSVRSRRVTRAIDRIAPCSIDVLADHLQGISGDSTDDLREKLYHVHLPRLSSIGMLQVENGSIDQQGHPGWDAELTNVLLSLDSDRVDGIIQSVSDRETRHVLAILESGPHWCDLDAFLTRIPETWTALDLHHRCLPKLHDLGLVNYAPDTRMILYHGDPLVTELLDAVATVSPHYR